MEYIYSTLFYLSAITAIIGALTAVFATKIIYSVLGAFFVFISAAVLFFALSQPYLGAVQTAVYAIGVSIVFVFALMLTDRNKEEQLRPVCKPRTVLAFIGLAVFMVWMCGFCILNQFDFEQINQKEFFNSIQSVTDFSCDLFINYGAPFVFSGLFFLAAVIGIGVIVSSHKGGIQ